MRFAGAETREIGESSLRPELYDIRNADAKSYGRIDAGADGAVTAIPAGEDGDIAVTHHIGGGNIHGAFVSSPLYGCLRDNDSMQTEEEG